MPLYQSTWEIISESGKYLHGFPDEKSKNEIQIIILNGLGSYKSEIVVEIVFSWPSALFKAPQLGIFPALRWMLYSSSGRVLHLNCHLIREFACGCLV